MSLRPCAAPGCHRFCYRTGKGPAGPHRKTRKKGWSKYCYLHHKRMQRTGRLDCPSRDCIVPGCYRPRVILETIRTDAPSKHSRYTRHRYRRSRFCAVHSHLANPTETPIYDGPIGPTDNES